jgi:DNA polymerase-1
LEDYSACGSISSGIFSVIRMPTLVLVDGSSYLYRAFHALPDLRTSQGEPTGALRGVLSMLRRMVIDGKPDYFAVVFDAPGRTFRDDWYPEYKANRTPMPDDLAKQIEPLHETIRAHGWPLLMIEGVEADDVIGTLATQANAQGIDTLISTSDKDFAQLVQPGIRCVNTMSNEALDDAGVQSKFGVKPEQVLDLLALTGDAIDNVPGVAKVGPKTAAKLLAEYGSLEGVIAHAGSVPGIVGENLRRVLDWLPQGKKLLTIRTDCELPLMPTDLKLEPADARKLAELFARFEFKAWIRDVAGGPRPAEDAAGAIAGKAAKATGRRFDEAGGLPAGDAKPADLRYETVLDHASFERWMCAIASAELVSFDTETSTLEPMSADVVGVSFCIEPGYACYIPLAHRYAGAPDQLDRDDVLSRMRAWFADPRRVKVGQNVKFDQHALANHGIELRGLAHDTLLQSYVLESHKAHDMDALAWRHLDWKTLTYNEVCG